MKYVNPEVVGSNPTPVNPLAVLPTMYRNLGVNPGYTAVKSNKALTFTPKQRYSQKKETANIGLDRSVVVAVRALVQPPPPLQFP